MTKAEIAEEVRGTLMALREAEEDLRDAAKTNRPKALDVLLLAQREYDGALASARMSLEDPPEHTSHDASDVVIEGPDEG